MLSLPAGCRGSADSRSSLGLGNPVGSPLVDPRFTRQVFVDACKCHSLSDVWIVSKELEGLPVEQH